MKHAKKMVMIPEVEYLTLLSMLKGDDPLKAEKALINAKMSQNLANKKISEDIKAKKYDWLLKQKRKLRELIDGKPQKVIVENLPPPVPNVPPYMGINQTQASKIDSTKKIPIRRIRKRRELTLSENTPYDSRSSSGPTIPTTQSSDSSSGEYDTPKADEKKIRKPMSSKQPLTTTPVQPMETTSKQNEATKSPSPMTPKSFNKLINYVAKNKFSLGITSDGNILAYNNKAVGGSNFIDTLKHMTGQLDSPPKGSSFLRGRLVRDPEFIKLFGQIGKGKKKKKLVVVKFNPIKTPGLKRNKIITFKPKIWAKL